MHIRRPVKRWSVSASLFGGYWPLIRAIAACYCGRHRWGATYFLRDHAIGESCIVCHKRRT